MSDTDFSLTVGALRSALDYDPDTGLFRWRHNRCKNKVKAGDVAGGISHFGYIIIKLDGRYYKAHRLAWLHVHGAWPPDFIDHINGVRTDNRLCNLRLATNTENQHNRKGPNRTSTHGLLGATWNNEARKWSSRIMVAGKRQHIGYFDTAQEAHDAYLAAKRSRHAFNTI